MGEEVKLYPPGALPASAFDRSAFVAEWNVVWSTLPMWRVSRACIDRIVFSRSRALKRWGEETRFR